MTIEVKLGAFEGPLDLLLHLIEKNKVNIYDIPISMITTQYLNYLDEMRKADLDVMSEFLVMAATLLQIKSQMLLPKQKDERGEEQDPRSELVQRLLEYKIYKYASAGLRTREIDAEKHFFKEASLPEEVAIYEEPIDPVKVVQEQQVTVSELKKIFEFVMQKREEKKDPIRSGFKEIKREEIKIEDKIESIRLQMKESKNLNFRQLLEKQSSKIEIVVTFLALLELMKMGDVLVEQEEIGEEIFIRTKEKEAEKVENKGEIT